MTNSGPSIDLSECEREPVHSPGFIQPFGSLIAFQLPTWTIAHVSTNAVEIFGSTSPEAMIGAGIETVLSPKIVHDLRNTFQTAIISGFAERLSGVPIGSAGESHDIIIYGSTTLAVAEFILSDGADTMRADPTALVKTIVDRLRRTTSPQAFLTSAARQIRAVTGYDRVMIYKFLEDESGKVVAEALRAGLSPFLGLRYPASDIPAQARALFKRQWLRMIQDVDGAPFAIVPSLTSKGTPLDLSLSTLRTASPIHLQYLRNMGVTASLTVSIMDGNKLWGLIACHHETSRRISATTGAAVELLAQMCSTQIESKEQQDELRYASAAREVHDQLVAAMEPEETIFENLLRFSAPLQEMIACDGVGVWTGGRFEGHGVTPPDDGIEELIRFLNTKPVDRIYVTHEIRRDVPDAVRYVDRVAGLLAIPFSKAPKDFVLLFRREVLQTVDWGGDPNKAASAKASGGLEPRASFAAWRETVRGTSLPWRRSETDIAETLRVSLLDLILRRANQIDRERRVAQEGQLLIVAELNHRVKNVLAVIGSLVRQSQRGDQSIETFTRDLQGRIHALSLAHDQLTQSHWKAAPLRSLVEVEAHAWIKVDDARLAIAGPPVMIEARAYQTLALVLHEMMTNAAKHGALSVKDGRLFIDWSLDATGDLVVMWREAEGPLVKPAARRGFGSIVVEQSIPFELQGEALIEYPPEGARATFKIPASFVQQGEATIGRRQLSSARADLQGKTLLLVEDSMMIALDAQMMLQGCGAEVELAATTKDARRAIQLNHFDAAILDVNLYTETSFLIAEDLQARAIPFVFATGYGETVTMPERFRDVHVISKPYAEDVLRAALAA